MINDSTISEETRKLAIQKGWDVEMVMRCLLSQSLLQKWLREEHKYNVTPHFSVKSGWNCNGVPLYHFGSVWTDYFETYEEALEKGLQEALKLIEQ
jgi:hypothetical protein